MENGLMPIGHEDRDIAIRYGVGPFTFLRKIMRMRVVLTHFTELAAHPAHQQFSIEDVPHDVQGLAVYACPVSEVLPRVARVDGALRFVTAQFRQDYVDLSGDFAGYLGKFSSKSRQTLNRKVRKFKEYCGEGFGWRVCRLPAEMAEFHTLAREVSAKTYQERMHEAGLPEGQQYVDWLVEEAARDAVRGYLLLNGAMPVAYVLCPIVQGILVYKYLGFDPEYSDLSPGTVLHYLMLESLFSERAFKMLDFTMGEGEHKRFFANGSVDCANMLFLRPTVGARVAIASKVASDALSAVIGKTLQIAGVKSRIRRLLRGQRTGLPPEAAGSRQADQTAVQKPRAISNVNQSQRPLQK
jgi:CelD/BcsL family acetyltransferase involved in cellulose biosynthesis